jgi:uncharacterized membrane protein YccC
MKKPHGCFAAQQLPMAKLSSYHLSVKIERLIHSIKIALAVLLGFFAIKFIPLHLDQWLIITIVVVMSAQLNIGSMLQKSLLRFIGTLAGAGIALAAICFSSSTIFFISIVILSSALFGYLATSNKSYSDAGTLGAVTVIIILMGQAPTLFTAVDRCMEICAGIALSALISRFVFPIQASSHLRNTQANTLYLLKKYYIAIFSDDIREDYFALEESIAKLMIKQRKLALDAKHETKTFNASYFYQSLWCEREILRCITSMHHAYTATIATKTQLSHLQILPTLHGDICQALSEIANSIQAKKKLTITLPTTQQIKPLIQQLTQTCTFEEEIILASFLFSVSILIVRLNKLLELTNQMAN